MSPATALLPLAYAPAPVPPSRIRTRAGRPCSPPAGGILVEECGGELQQRMYPWFAVSLVRSPAVLMVESRREAAVGRNSVLLIPPFQLYGLRAQGARDPVAVTLLLGGAQIEGLPLPAQAGLVTDPALCEKVAALIPQLQPSLLEQLLGCSIAVDGGRFRQASALAPVRNYLRSRVSEPVSIEVLARISGLSQCHLIRAFHYEFGLPPYAYHLRVRLAFACELLARRASIASVAYECGFADQSHLARKFKAVYGVTPAAWSAAATSFPGRRLLPVA